MAENHNKKLNDLLKSIHQCIFHQRTKQQLMSLISEAQKLTASTYTIPFEKISNKDHVTDNDQELDVIKDNKKKLHEVLLQSTLDMKKICPVHWTN